MFAVTVTFTIRAGQVDFFLPLVHQNARTAISKEAGCSQFDVCYDKARPNMVFLYEVYDTEAAFQAHLASDHYAEFQNSVSSMVSHKDIHSYAKVLR